MASVITEIRVGWCVWSVANEPCCGVIEHPVITYGAVYEESGATFMN